MIQWYSTGGVCEDSTVEVCSGEPGEKWLKTQYINKSLPAPLVMKQFISIRVGVPEFSRLVVFSS